MNHYLKTCKIRLIKFVCFFIIWFFIFIFITVEVNFAISTFGWVDKIVSVLQHDSWTLLIKIDKYEGFVCQM